MSKRKIIEEPENHERWLVSYADFITLLFAFFVVMYSLSSLNEGKYRAMSNSVLMAFGKLSPAVINPQSTIPPGMATAAPTAAAKSATPVPPSGNGVLPMTRKPAPTPVPTKQEQEKMTGLAQGILNALAPLIRTGQVRVTQNSRGILIDINASVLFAVGDAKLTQQSSQALQAIASVLASDNHDIEVEGFTDNVPIKSSKFASNWELSATRAGSVVRLFMDSGIGENRLTAIGQGPKNPVGSNETAAGRASNRRVNITILSLLPDKRTELSISPAKP